MKKSNTSKYCIIGTILIIGLSVLSVYFMPKPPQDILKNSFLHETTGNDAADLIITKQVELYGTDLPLETRKQIAKDLAIISKEEGVELIQKMFPDLIEIKELNQNKENNILDMEHEIPYYSVEGDFTVIKCTNRNIPLYIFDGKPSDKEDYKEAISKIQPRNKRKVLSHKNILHTNIMFGATSQR